MSAEAATTPPAPAKRTSLADLLGRDPTVTMLGALIVLAVVFFGVLAPSRFLSGETLRAMAFQMPELGILALAMMIPLMSGGLNLAIIATANLSALVMAAILTKMLGPESPPQVIVRGDRARLGGRIADVFADRADHGDDRGVFGRSSDPGDAWHNDRGQRDRRLCHQRRGHRRLPAAVLFLGNGTLLGFPVPMILFILCAILVAVIMNHAPFGVSVRMIGSNEKATRYSGVATEWMLVGVYVVSSVLCWVAAAVMMARFNSARAGYAESYLLITILAAVLGGVDPNGGFGKVLGLFLSLILLQLISTGFNLLGFSPHLTQAIWGATMILAIAIALVRDKWMARLWLKKA